MSVVDRPFTRCLRMPSLQVFLVHGLKLVKQSNWNNSWIDHFAKSWINSKVNGNLTSIVAIMRSQLYKRGKIFSLIRIWTLVHWNQNMLCDQWATLFISWGLMIYCSWSETYVSAFSFLGFTLFFTREKPGLLKFDLLHWLRVKRWSVRYFFREMKWGVKLSNIIFPSSVYICFCIPLWNHFALAF